MHRAVVAIVSCSVLAWASSGCAPVGPAPRGPYTIIGGDPRSSARVPEVEQEEWSVARARLAILRRSTPSRPYVERVRIALTDPRTRKRFQARGAVAVSPGRAARLVLLGPGGTTALDLWVTPGQFRLSIPSLHLHRRGGADPESARGLPIGFFRWWLLAPLEGNLLLGRSSGAEAAFLLREGRATVMMRTDGARFFAIRREGGRTEALEWIGRGLVPRAGARGRYLDLEWGVRVELVVEDVLSEEPDPAAFEDPDEEGTTL